MKFATVGRGRAFDHGQSPSPDARFDFVVLAIVQFLIGGTEESLIRPSPVRSLRTWLLLALSATIRRFSSRLLHQYVLRPRRRSVGGTLGTHRSCSASPIREAPRLCRGGSRSLTFTAVAYRSAPITWATTHTKRCFSIGNCETVTLAK